MTRTMRAWKKANHCIRENRHTGAVYWLNQTKTILESSPPPRRRGDELNTIYILAALLLVFAVWVSA